VAFLNPRDRWHEWAKAKWAETIPPLKTCEAVLSEACFLVRRMDQGLFGLLALMERGVVQLSFDLAGQFDPVAELLRKYSDVPMSLADACLVRMSETTTECVVCTLGRDFHRYRRHRRQKIPLLVPPDA
jgi:predicted nucleic acid-binding protein